MTPAPPSPPWLRRDIASGAVTRIARLEVAGRMSAVYDNWREAMDGASEAEPLTNGLAIYWPETIDER